MRCKWEVIDNLTFSNLLTWEYIENEKLCVNYIFCNKKYKGIFFLNLYQTWEYHIPKP